MASEKLGAVCERISYGFEYENGERVLVVEPVDKFVGPNYLRFGLRAATDFQGDNQFMVLGNYTMTWLNRLGAQWRNDVGLGSSSFARTEFYQPLSLAGPWFVAPSAFVGRQVVNFFEGDAVAAQVRETRAIAALDAGATLGTSAQFRAGVFTGTVHATPTVIIPGVSNVNAGLGGYQFSAAYDTRDNVGFPRTGTFARAGLTFSRTDLGSDLNYQQAEASWLSAWSFGRNTVSAALRGGSGFNSDLPFYDLYAIGGFLNLSGYRVNQRMDVGAEVFWVPMGTAQGTIRTTHLDAVAQFRPWTSAGFFMKGGAGMAYVRNWIDTTSSESLNSKALSVVIGAGWEFMPLRRVGF
jgi:NTE family protein